MPDLSPEDEFILVNTFTAASGRMEALVAFQLAEMREMSAEASSHGWLGNEVYRTEDGTRLIVVTRFKSPTARESWAATERAQRHVRDLMPFVEAVDSVPVIFLARYGEQRYRER